MKLLGSVASPYTRKVRIVAAEKHIDLKFILVEVSAPDTEVPKSNPLGKIPVLILEDGHTLFDSRVIVEFLDGVSPLGHLIPEDKRHRIAVKRWEALADGVLDAGILIRNEQSREPALQSAAWLVRQTGKLERGLSELARELGDQAWCSGQAYSLADLALGCCLGWLSLRFPHIDWRTQYPNLARHYDKLSERPAFAETAPPKS